MRSKLKLADQMHHMIDSRLRRCDNLHRYTTTTMPPRKRARVSQAASPTPASQPETPTPVEGSPTKVAEHNHNDPWTDKEEIGLFKGLIKWKPTGMRLAHHLSRLTSVHC